MVIEPTELVASVAPGPAERRGRLVSLGGGVKVPYPEPASPAATGMGKANPRAGTRPEVRLRSELHRRGVRFRKDHQLSVSGLRVRPDVVFTAARTAVFVDGCFWHVCPVHGRQPRTNTGYWIPKLAANVARDRRVDQILAISGWVSLRVWEHEPVPEAADRILAALRAGRDRGEPTADY